MIQNDNEFPVMSLRKVKLSQSYSFKLLALLFYVAVLLSSLEYSIYLINLYNNAETSIIYLILILVLIFEINILGLIYLVKQKSRYVVVSDKKTFTTDIYKTSYYSNYHEQDGIIALRDIEKGPFNIHLNYWQKSINDPSKSEYVHVKIPSKIYHVENRTGEDILDANNSTKFTATYEYSNVGKMSLFSNKIKPTDYVVLYAVIIRVTNIMN